MELFNVLKRLRTERSLTQPQVAAYLTGHGSPVTHKAVSKWERGLTMPNAEQLILLCALYGVRDVQASFLGASSAVEGDGLNDKGRSRLREYAALLRQSAEFSSEARIVRPARFIPLYELPVSAGYGLSLDSDNYELVEADGSVPREASFAVRISGDSMLPRFVDGQLVYVSRSPALEAGDIGIFLLNGAAYCKRLSLDPPALVSLNSAYPAMGVGAGDELCVLGKVVG